MKRENQGIYLMMLQVCKEHIKKVLIIISLLIASVVIAYIQPLLLSKLTDRGILGQNVSNLLFYSLIMFIISQLRGVFDFMIKKIIIDIHNVFELQIYEKIYRKLVHIKVHYFCERSQTEILNFLSSDIDNICSIFSEANILKLNFFLCMIVGIVGICSIDWKLLFIVLIIVPLKIYNNRVFAKRVEKNSIETYEMRQHFCAVFSDIIGGIKEIKLWSLLEMKKQELFFYINAFQKCIKNEKLNEEGNLVIETLFQNLTTVLSYIVGGILIIRQQITFGELMAFISYSSTVIAASFSIINVNLDWAEKKNSFLRIIDFLEEQEELVTGDKKCEFSEMILNVSFGYGINNIIINKVNLKLKKGEKIAIVGENGCGKTTLINLILRFILPQSGQILINGIAIDEIDLNYYRKNIAVVEQFPYYFQTSIKKNVDLLGTNNIDKLQRKGILFSDVALLIERKNEVNISELSGGEKKRIVLAREMLKQASIIIFDEPTAHGDFKLREQFKEMICALDDKIVIMISHFSEEINCMDRIYSLKDGKLIEIPKPYVDKRSSTEK